MEFNSLDAQREACEAFVASQKALGWVLVPDRYDDGGSSCSPSQALRSSWPSARAHFHEPGR
jgi:hypothetical protein